MRVYRFELVEFETLTVTLETVSAEGWTLLSVHLHVGGTTPQFYCLWDKPVV